MRRPCSHVLAATIAMLAIALPGCGVEAGRAPTRQAPQSADAVVVTFVDVGKGDCILVQAGGQAALIDTGYEDTANEVVSRLRDQGVDELACLVITHYDRDHIGGTRAIGKALPIDTVYLPGYEGADKNYANLMAAVEELGLPTRQVTEEVDLRLGDAALAIFPSKLTYEMGSKDDEGNDNDLSLVASLTYHDDSYLFAGDLEKDGIDAYLAEGHGQFDVLKMPHHGQKCGKNDELLKDVQPRICVITDTKDDPADKKTLSLLEEAGTDTYRTSTDGTVVVRSQGSGSYEVTTEQN